MIAILYILFILLADILAARWIVPLFFGLAVPAGVFAIAPIFSLRDGIHERWGRRGAYILIATASIISWGLAVLTGSTILARVTLASVLSFVVNESLDTEIYQSLRSHSKLLAILGSNTISSLVDSVLFIWIAFGPLYNLMLGQYLVKMLLAGIIGIWMVRKWELNSIVE
jgi:uncharacterized PurR-regulated membrane protein YhhQ (DUF165 family)